MNTTVTTSTSPSTSTSASATAAAAQQQLITNFTSNFLNDNDLFLSNQLPNQLKTRLFDIFGQIEKEFEVLYTDNARLRAKLNDDSPPPTTTSGSVSAFVGNLVGTRPPTTTPLTVNTSAAAATAPTTTKPQLISPTATTTITTIKARNTTLFPKFTNNLMQTIKNSNVNSSSSSQTSSEPVNSGGNSGNQQSTVTTSTFKEQYQVEARFKQTLVGHKDGIWDMNCVQLPDVFLRNLFDLKSLHVNNTSSIQHASSNLLCGTASADYSAKLWLMNGQSQQNAYCIQQYVGHQGSVNSIRFHPNFLTNNLILTASGDSQAHIWQFLLPIDNASSPQFLLNDDLVDNLYNYYNYTPTSPAPVQVTPHDDVFSSSDNLLRTPLNRYRTHTDACVAADWLPDGDYIVTASWDRTSNIYNVETSKLICTLSHDDQLTNLNIHATHNLILTSSKDTTFKLWDIRVKQQTINIYHGHARSVNSAIFLYDTPSTYNRVATTSDDHTCKIWDLRNMKQAQCQINLNSSINRLCTQQNPLTQETILCLPLDNRDIKLYTLNGERVARLQRTSRLGHKRAVTSICSHGNLLLSASFDKQAICWSVDYTPTSNKESQKQSMKQHSSSSSSKTTTLNALQALMMNSQNIPAITSPVVNNSVQQQLSKKNSSSNVLTTMTTNTPLSPQPPLNDGSSFIVSSTSTNKKDLLTSNNKKLSNERIKI